jgi:oligopeptide transport system ATP-binding protein
MVKFISDRIAVMLNGIIVELGNADDVYNNPIHPYTKSLISAIPHPDPDTERSRKRIAYTPANTAHCALREITSGRFGYCDENGKF